MKIEYKYLGHLPTKIVKLLWRNNRLTRRVFVRELGYARSTIYDNLVKLEKRGVVEREEFNNGKRGRPIKFWFLTDSFVIDMESELDNEQMPEL